ncbi:hypothetical protein MFLAVUS_007266 [Mucor flavus]|uniref:Uncharacterized protein n=1 Tax=Mucor flavus TaxID=439312 RepID=A0ABP9Z3V6_9FUNG
MTVLSFVSLCWYVMAIPLSWEAVTLKRRNISLVKSLLNDFEHSQYFKYSHLITKLAFKDYVKYEDPYKFSRLELLELLNQLPNINEIDFSGTNYPEEYLGFLLDADMQHISKINTGSNLFFTRSNLLFSVYNKFRSSITCIRLLYDKNMIHFNSPPTNVLNLLTQFDKLTKLELHNKDDINLTPFQVQDKCPNLEHLGFFSRHPISESAMRHILYDSRRINLNFISSLTYLVLGLPSLSATYTRYLVDYFPNQLTTLNIKMSLQNIFDWIDIVGMELALRLMERVSSIDKTYIGFTLRDEYEVRFDNEDNMTKYFKLLNSFKGTRQTHCTANFNYAIGEIRDVGYSFRYNSLGRLLVTYNLYRHDLYGFNAADMAAPDKTSSVIGPEIFHVLEFNLLGLYDEDEIFSDQANRDIDFFQIEYIKPDKFLFDLVTTHLHNIEIVSVKARDWGHKFHEPYE